MPIDVSALADAIARQHNRSPFSGVIYVQEEGEVVHAQGYGFANRSEQLPNSIHTRLGIASGAKTFTAVAVCQLVERGLVTFDTPLKECLDIAFPHFDPALTIHHLLTHSAGIPDYFNEAVMDDYEALWRERPMYALRTPEDFLPLFAGEPMQFKPGERWAYNNAGYIVLGLVVEKLTGMPFAKVVEEHVFQPCEMMASGYFAMDRLPGGTALGYIPVGDDEWRANIYSMPIVGGPDGGVYTTAPDLAGFWDALLGYRLLSRATVDKMLTPHWHAKSEGDDTHYGYGLWMEQQKGKARVYYMLGEDPGVAFFSGFYPAGRIQFSLIGNTVAATWPMLKCITPLLKTLPDPET